MGLFDFVGDFFEKVFSWFVDIPESGRQEILVNKKSNVAPLPIVYGTRKVGGTIIFKSVGDKPTGNDKKDAYLYMAIALCEGEIESVLDIWINDKHISEYPSKDIRPVHALAPTEAETDIVIHKYRGTDDQPASELLLNADEWTAAHTLSGVAYLACRFKYNPEVLGSGDPKINCVVKGKKCYDPRDTITRYTENAALVWNDYMTSSRYGKGLTAAEINQASLIAAANDCDGATTFTGLEVFGTPSSVYTLSPGDPEINVQFFNIPATAFILPGATVQNDNTAPTKVGRVKSGYTSPGFYGRPRSYTLVVEMEVGADFTTADTIYTEGDSQRLYSCNIVVDTGETMMDNVKRILASMRGNMPYIQGQYFVEVEKDKPSVFSIQESHILGGVQVDLPKKESKYNRVTAKFANPNGNWEEDIAIFPEPGSVEESTLLAEDNNAPLYYEVELESVTNKYQANDLARIILYKSRANIRCRLRGTSELLELVPGDVVDLTYTGYGWTNKLFMVSQMGLGDDGTVSLELTEHTPGIYNYQGIPLDIVSDDTNLPDPFDIPQPVNVAGTSFYDERGGRRQAGINVTWDDIDYAGSDRYEVRYVRQGDTAYTTVISTQTEVDLVPLAWLFTYDIQVRAISRLGKFGEWSDVYSHQILLDTTPPDPPTGIATNPASTAVQISWINPTDFDFKRVALYYDTVDVQPPTPVQFAGDASTTDTIAGLTPSTDYYFWITAEDDAGNESTPVPTGLVRTLPKSIDDETDEDVGGKKRFLDGIYVGDGLDNATDIDMAEFTKLLWDPPQIPAVQTEKAFIEYINFVNARPALLFAPEVDSPLGLSYLFLTGTFNGPDDPFIVGSNDNGWRVRNQIYTDSLNENIVTQARLEFWSDQETGKRVRWSNQWLPQVYSQNDMVQDDGWLMVANKTTTDRAAPQPIGSAFYLLDDEDPNWAEQNPLTTFVATGHRYAWTVNGWYLGYKVYIPEVGPTIYYRTVRRIIYGNGDEVTQVGGEFQPSQPGWLALTEARTLVEAGTTFELLLYQQNKGATATVNANYNYTSSNQDIVPGSGVAHRQLNRTWVRFNKQDADANPDPLASVVAGTTITAAGGTSWTVRTVTDATTYYEYEITGAGNPADGLITFTFVIPSASVNHSYVENLGYWTANPPTAGTITGIRNVGGVVIEGTNDAYGVDLLVQEADISDDWDFAATSETALGGGGSGIDPGDAYMPRAGGAWLEDAIQSYAPPSSQPGAAIVEHYYAAPLGQNAFIWAPQTGSVGYLFSQGSGLPSLGANPTEGWEITNQVDNSDDSIITRGLGDLRYWNASNINAGTLAWQRLPDLIDKQITIGGGLSGGVIVTGTGAGFSIDATGIILGRAGFNANNQRIVAVANGVSGTDAVNVNQLNGKANTSHTHSASQITSGTFSTARLPGTVVYSDTTQTISGAKTFSNNMGVTGVLTVSSGANLQGGALMGGNRVQSVATPSVGFDAANKNYVDGSVSDINAKTNITDQINTDIIYDLRVVSFEYNYDALDLPDKPCFRPGMHYGVIAQEAESVIPEAVFDSVYEGYKAFDYEMLIPLLVKEVQELRKELDALKSRPRK